ncbi:MAG: hypothetical protein Q4B61_07435 [Bacteroidales bacterium]|nr:hypothetical protein [Bacteroidales bacterium]
MEKIHKYIFNRVIAVVAIFFAFGISLSLAQKDYIFLFKDGKCVKYLDSYNVDSITFAPTIYLSNEKVYISEDCEYASLLFYCTPSMELSQSDVYWSSSDKSVATVRDGHVYPKGVGQCVITCNYGKQSVSCTVEVLPSEEHEYVDLGLPSGTLWASSNLKYIFSTLFNYGELYGKTPGKIHVDSVITDKGFLRTGFDAASVYWGKDWRTPTYKEFEELLMYTKKTGDTIRGRNGNFIILEKSDAFLRWFDYWISDGVYLQYSGFVPGGFNVGYFSQPLETAIELSFRDQQVASDEAYIRPVRNRKVDEISVRVAYDELEMYDTDAPVDLHFNSSPFYAIPDSTVVWRTTDKKVATVKSGVVTPYAEGECEIIGEVDGFSVSTKVRVSSYKSTGSDNGYSYVDLGLPSGNKWATCDLGSTIVEKNGDTYPWGDLVPDSYLENEKRPHKFKNLIECDQHKNNSGNITDIRERWKCFIEAGVLDSNLALTPNNDAATVVMGSHWKIPTSKDYQELLDNTTPRITSLRGVRGVVFKSTSNGNAIFIPGGWHLLSDASIKEKDRVMGTGIRSSGGTGEYMCEPTASLSATSVCAIRPIYVDNEIERPKVDSVYLKTTVLELSQTDKPTSLGFSCSNGDDVPASEAIWKSSDTMVATVKDGIVYPAQYINPIPVSECTITCQYKTFTLTAKVTLNRNKIDLSQPVDMGLPSGVMWAPSNIEASSVEDLGTEYVWGDLDFDASSNSKVQWEGKKFNELYELGVLDSLKNLTPKYDIVVSVLGGNWRMPTIDDALELCNNCIRTKATINGAYGILYTSKINNNAIFIPTGGSDYCNSIWTSSYVDSYSYRNAKTFVNEEPGDCVRIETYMHVFEPIRPVYVQKK